MTEQKAIEILSLSEDMKRQLPNLKEVYEVAVKALKEVQRYRALEQRVKNLFGENMDLFGLVEELHTVRVKEMPGRRRAEQCAYSGGRTAHSLRMDLMQREDAEVKTHGIKPGDTVYFAWPNQGIVTDDIVKDVGTKYLIFEDFLEPIENLGVRVFKTEKEAVEALKEK